MTTITKVDSGITTQVFENVSFYTMGAFGADRTDCKHLTVQYGVKWAQYNDAVRISYLEKGKRKPVARILSYNKYLMIVNTKDAIKVVDCFDAKADSNGFKCSQTRYATFDERWLSDWEAQSKDMPHLVLINER